VSTRSTAAIDSRAAACTWRGRRPVPEPRRVRAAIRRRPRSAGKKWLKLDPQMFGGGARSARATRRGASTRPGREGEVKRVGTEKVAALARRIIESPSTPSRRSRPEEQRAEVRNSIGPDWTIPADVGRREGALARFGRASRVRHEGEGSIVPGVLRSRNTRNVEAPPAGEVVASKSSGRGARRRRGAG
jgi:hypothetical protein